MTAFLFLFVSVSIYLYRDRMILQKKLIEALRSSESSFLEGPWKEDLNYLDSLSANPIPEDLVEFYKSLEKEDLSLGKNGSGWVFERSWKLNAEIKKRGLPISTTNIRNKISQLEELQNRIREIQV